MVPKKLLAGVGFVVIVLFGIHLGVEYRNTKKTEAYLEQFAYLPPTDSYAESAPDLYFGDAKPFAQAVLLLHGYSAAPAEFDHLYPALEEAGIPYYAPRLVGFGTRSMHLLTVLEPEDMIRHAVESYDLLASLAERVDIIAHSNGGVLGAHIASQRDVNRLLLSGPNLFPAEGDRFARSMISAPVVGDVFEFLVPVFVKPTRPGRPTNSDTMDSLAAARAFHYPALPTQSLSMLWGVQDELDLDTFRARQVYLLYGRHDLSVDIEQTKRTLEDHRISFTAIEYPRSAHNILEDYDHAQATADIIRILTSDK